MFTRYSGIVATLLLVCLITVLAQAPPPVSFLPAVNYPAGTVPIPWQWATSTATASPTWRWPTGTAAM